MKKNFMRSAGRGIASFCRLNRPLFAVIWMTALCAAVFTSCEKEDPTYTVTFDSKGGSQVAAQTVKTGGKVAKPADPTRENYIFDGWAKADNETGAFWDFETETVSGDMTLFARWAINTYLVTFDSDGGSAVTSQNIEHSDRATKPADPTRDGYEFDGWFSGEMEWNFSTAITAPVTLKAKWTVAHIVTFDSDGGSEVSAQTIRNGATATRPANPTKEFRPASGLYLGTVNLSAFPSHQTFVEWRREGESTAFDFNTPVNAPVTLKAVWSTPSVSLTPITSVLPNDIAAAFTYVNANSYSGEEYTLLIGTNVTIAPQTLNAANAKLTIIGIGAERTITTSDYGSLFTINGNNATGLTLGQNITCSSIYLHAVHVRRGILTMRNGSKITGMERGDEAVLVDGLNSVFKMEGGEVSGNNWWNNFYYTDLSCVHISNGATFEMTGGSITDNNNRRNEVIIGHDCTFRLSGNARIGTLTLYAYNYSINVITPAVNIAGNYSGTVTSLNLNGSTVFVDNIIAWWTNVPVIVNGTEGIINMFNNGLGNFGFGGTAKPISATHVLNASGILVLKEN